jgi:crotonobetainyl-CoA:carnitine CoA-transferase CaiB-like acyl-CoA transferase
MVQPLRRIDGSETKVAAAGFPLKFSRSHTGHDAPAPAPGGDTEAILKRFLGIGADEARALRGRGVL